MGFYKREIETEAREVIEEGHLARLRQLLAHTFEKNPFYRRKYTDAGLSRAETLMAAARSAESFRDVPFTTKAELLADQQAHPPHGTNLACPPAEFVRQHQTSGTTGAPLKVWETRESWDWMTKLWLYQFHALDVTPADTVFMAFNFGQGLGLWNALDAGVHIGALTITGGGLSSLQRVESITSNQATVLICTPSYALRLAEAAEANRIDIRSSAVRAIVTAGEPGASIPGTRARIENAWNARLYDSPGATEVGHFGLLCPCYGVHVVESEFYVEMLDPQTSGPVAPGQAGEIVVTNFGRPFAPVIRYRTGDIAKAVYEACGCGRTLMRFDGGILGRSDDMFVVRGVNVFPSAIEAIIRESPDITEYAVEVFEDRGMFALRIRIEVRPASNAGDALAVQLREVFHRRLFLKTDVEVVPASTLPRFEGKAKRVTRATVS
jgi:phenylacetate-CoA ligase